MDKDFYTVSHLIVATIRILEYRNVIPLVEEVCKELSLPLEQGYYICNKLDEFGIIEMLRKGAEKPRLFINDHLKIEEIPRDTKGSTIQEEIEKFQNARRDFKQEIESYQAKKAQEQKDLFAEIESRFKQKLKKEPETKVYFDKSEDQSLL